uniref:C2H2-type domain-containing protein n=1 Tax=Poecilia mexicana TaxID=48701 RepID=A0A3B3XYN8_9TELE
TLEKNPLPVINVVKDLARNPLPVINVAKHLAISVKNHLHAASVADVSDLRKLLSCDKCDKKFARKSHLQRHVLIHAGKKKPISQIKKFACKECGKRFLENYQVRRHMVIHIGEKPFSCNLCSKTFARAEGVKMHNKRIHFK